MYDNDDLFTTDGKDVWTISEMFYDPNEDGQKMLLREIRSNYFIRGIVGEGDLKDFRRLVPDPIIIIREETPEEFTDKMVDFIIAFHKLGAVQRQEIFQKVAKKFIGQTPKDMEDAFKKGQEKGQNRNNN